jgi:3-hydroxyisobutyrate dehydrogenase-like beta-hydroxyacid dehydrogenase
MEIMMDRKVGFIGLGEMGRWMACNILNAGFDLTVYDIVPEAVVFLVDQGARSAASPADLASRVNWILLSLPSTAVVEQVVFGENGLLEGSRLGQVVVDCGTTGYQATLDIAHRLKQAGLEFVDAPVSGMEARAREGTLTVMFGGELNLFDRMRPLFESFGKEIIYMGETGSGQLTKLTNQLLFNISCAAIAEILPMAARLGLDPEKVLAVVNTGTGRSFASENFGPHILEGVFRTGYPLKHAYKDMVSAAEISAYQKIPLPVLQAATTTYQMALAQGYGDEGKGAMIKVFERILGVEFRRRKGTA